jgi:tetratricopeptide (TPR) repeat protein
MLSGKFLAVVLSLVVLSSVFLVALPALAQNSEQVQVGPPPLHRAEPPAPGATADELEKRGDELRTDKNYLDAYEYYAAALRKEPNNSVVLNKAGICEMMMQRFKDARKTLERAVKADKQHADALNNLGVVYYEMGVLNKDSGDFGRAIKMYNKAIAVNENSASYYNNRGAAYFAKKKFEPATADYAKALSLDADIVERSSHAGVQAMLPSPEDRARYDYEIAKLYAKNGIPERSLHYLRKAMEDGYKDIGNVYKDNEFTQVRKDPRFTELMASKPVGIPD